jgi:hypothetical protein
LFRAANVDKNLIRPNNLEKFFLSQHLSPQPTLLISHRTHLIIIFYQVYDLHC